MSPNAAPKIKSIWEWPMRCAPQHWLHSLAGDAEFSHLKVIDAIVLGQRLVPPFAFGMAGRKLGQYGRNYVMRSEGR